MPPQLIGIIDDARREGIDTFTLEYSRALVMASFSSLNHATEIDFEFKSGDEMFRFLLAGAHRYTASRALSIPGSEMARRFKQDRSAVSRAVQRVENNEELMWAATAIMEQLRGETKQS